MAALISLFAPLTQAGWNPARDFGPRVVAYFEGWGEIAIPGPRAGFWAYIAGPMLGAPLGAALHELLIKPAPPSRGESGRAPSGRESCKCPHNPRRFCDNMFAAGMDANHASVPPTRAVFVITCSRREANRTWRR